jgi:DeoR/GlpR family transcriptional regulator of sugar metabolism
MTIRRELNALAREGKVIRTHGGATLGEKVLFDFQFLQRARVQQAAKAQIAAAAAALIRDGQSVMADSGTTTLALARQLQGRKGLTLVTTSLPIAAALQHAAGVGVLLLGGFVRRDAADLTGALTEANLESLRADLAFLGADGIDLSGRVYSDSPEVARLLGKMAAAAQITYIVADRTKIGRTALARFGSVAKWGGLITDGGVSRAQAAALRRAGVHVIVGKSTQPRK